jgi:hypothetical protein
MLRRIFGPKRDEVTGDWRNLHNEDLHNFDSLPNIIRMTKSRRMWWAGHVAQMGEMRNGNRILLGKPEGKRQLGSPRRRWVANIKIQRVSNIFVPGSVGYVACPRSAAGSQPVLPLWRGVGDNDSLDWRQPPSALIVCRVGWHKDVWNAL